MTNAHPSSASSSPGVWEPPAPEALQALLPQYEISAMLGRGGMGAVYKGIQKTLGRPVAIKILSTALEESEMGFAERFKNEARALGRLSHPGIVGVYDFGSAANGLLYIVMEFVDGTDVSKMLAKKGRLPVDHAMAITAHVCDALAYAHERGIIHRDIKPANIMVGYDGVVRVADFGLAKMSHDGQSGLTQSGMAMGTLHYMAPEALMLGSAVDHRADIYAVGVMLYQMLAGKLPQGLFEMPSKLVEGLDPRYDAIISKAMREDREVRYQSILALRADLDHILTQPVIKVEAAAEHASVALPTQARPQRTIPQRQPVPAPEFVPPPPPRSPVNTLVWAVVVVLACVAAWLVVQRGRATSTAGNTAGIEDSSEKTSPPTTSQLATTSSPSSPPSPPTAGVWINGLEAWWNGHGRENEAFSREKDTQARVQTDYALLHPLPGNAPMIKDQAVRARGRLPDGKGSFRVLLRMTKTPDDKNYMADLNEINGHVRLGFYLQGKYTGIQDFTLPTGFDFKTAHTLEMRVIGKTIQLSLDGSILGTPYNTEIAEGHPAVSGTTGTVIESFEFVNLDSDITASSQTKPTSEAPSATSSTSTKRPSATQPPATASQAQSSSPSQSILAQPPELLALEQQYRAAIEKQVTPAVTEYAKTLLASYRNALDRAARAPGVSSTDATALRAETQRLATDPTVPDADPPGTPQALITLRHTYRQAVVAFRSEKEEPLKAIYNKQVREWKTALLAGATKDQPFTNILGMKFVPVPGTQVLMCIHETRNKEYGRFADSNKDTNNKWRNPMTWDAVSISEGAENPVLNVSFEDAMVFCRWLRNQEGITYRLPSDREWSQAVGIAEEEVDNVHPAELNKTAKSHWPWGTTWPPPEGAGNIPDGTYAKRYPTAFFIKEYEDGYIMTAPVMSFKPNSFGIYDLAGNAEEICDTWLTAENQRKVVRGGGWHLPMRRAIKNDLRSGWRTGIAPGERSNSTGFRCVVDLAASGVAPSSAQAPVSVNPPSNKPPMPTPLPGTLTGPLKVVRLDKPPSRGWRPLVDNWAAILSVNKRIEKKGSQIVLQPGAKIPIQGTRNAAVRVRFAYAESYSPPYIKVRWSTDFLKKNNSYSLRYSYFRRMDMRLENPSKLPGHFTESETPFGKGYVSPGDKFEMVLMIVGNQLATFLNGSKAQEFFIAVDPTEDSLLGVSAGKEKVSLTEVEWVPLDDQGQPILPEK
jgi:serine/threonine protein kinase